MGDNQTIRVVPVKGHIMKIILGAGTLLPCFPAVQGLPELVGQHPELIPVEWAGVQVMVVERALDDTGVI